MKPLGSHTTTERSNRKQRRSVLTAMKRGRFAGLGKRQGISVRLCWAGNRSVWERGQVSESQACGEGWGAKVAEGSRDNRVEADDCPGRETIETELQPNNRNKKDIFCLNKPWKRLICSVKVVGTLDHMTPELGSPREQSRSVHTAFIRTQNMSFRALTNLHPDAPASLRYLCSFIPHRMPPTHSIDLSPI
jgi:hypothetical protein